jgi:hypothetical protein
MAGDFTSNDIRTFLERLCSAIETDQIRVDSMSSYAFMPVYSDDTWRIWRHDHLAFIGRLLATVDAVSSITLGRVSEAARSQEPHHVGRVLLELFADVVSGSVSEEDLGTAERFFALVTTASATQPSTNRQGYDVRSSINQWFPFADPLDIAKDPECGYSLKTH